MQSPTQQSTRSAAAVRAFIVGAAAVALLAACDRQTDLPTSPPVAAPVTPLAMIVGVSSTSLPLSAEAINDAGHVVGAQGARAVLWTPAGGVQDLGTLGGPTSVAYAINAADQVVGASTTATGAQHAFLWTPGHGMQDLGTLPGGVASKAYGINDKGQVVGQSLHPPIPPRQEPVSHAFLWTPGVGMQDLGTLSPDLTSSIAYDINNAGQVVGRGFPAERRNLPPTDPEYLSRAFLWAPGNGMQDLGDLGGGYSVAYAINDAGQVVGRSWLDRSVFEYGVLYSAFLWTSDEGMRSLGGVWQVPSVSAAYGINEFGQVVGTSDKVVPIPYPAIPFQAFLWSAVDGMEALSPTTDIRAPRDINNRQQVVGDGRLATLHLAPGNNLPTAVPGGPYSGTEGSPVPLVLSGTDDDDIGFLFTVSFGDGSRDWFDVVPLRNYTYADNGTYTLALTVRDRRGATDTKTTTVTIANAAPTLLAGSLTGPTTPIQLTASNASAPITLAFTDPAGSNDTYTAQIDCGDGTVLTPSAISSPLTATCTYASAGVYTVRATVSDEDGGTSEPAYYRYVIVYDPEGASARGSGFYTVPGQGNRKAHFTFEAKFPPGQTVPNGKARFWIPGAEMDFESTAIEMLVVSGNRAQFWGIGTVNGAAARFRITVVDAKAFGHHGSPDAIRIELWDGAGTALFYDTQPGAARDAPVTNLIDGGSIRIHH